MQRRERFVAAWYERRGVSTIKCRHERIRHAADDHAVHAAPVRLGVIGIVIVVVVVRRVIVFEAESWKRWAAPGGVELAGDGTPDADCKATAGL